MSSFELRAEPHPVPGETVELIANAVVQPVRPALPELDCRGNDAVATPERRQWQRGLAVEALLDLGDPPLQLLSAGDAL